MHPLKVPISYLIPTIPILHNFQKEPKIIHFLKTFKGENIFSDVQSVHKLEYSKCTTKTFRTQKLKILHTQCGPNCAKKFTFINTNSHFYYHSVELCFA